MKKVFHSAEQAIDGLIFDGMKIASTNDATKE